MSARPPVTLPVALLVAVVSLVGGGVVGAAATAVHGRPVGLALSLVATTAALLALPAGWWARLPFALGWLLVVFYFANPRSEGDYLVASNGSGYVLLGSGMAAVAFALITLRPFARRALAEDVGSGEDPS